MSSIALSAERPTRRRACHSGWFATIADHKGWPLGPNSAWWQCLVHEPEPGFTDEDGARTFALSETMVCRKWTGHGHAHRLHDELLRLRPEKRATLLVEPDKGTAYRSYTRWGWTKVSQLHPGWPDAPLYDVLILSLPL